MLITSLGVLAAALTSFSYIPQVRKALPRGSTADLSLKTLSVLAMGPMLWILYGIAMHDYVIVVANAIGVSLVGALISFKLRDSNEDLSKRPRPAHHGE